ncbi:hypothetical protein N431DRAFT_431801 [Stipitochalara longipes BDJ]|nr:hypothetical protein N431DRAFT_431801 [Stipitochalara longipes BDJ]
MSMLRPIKPRPPPDFPPARAITPPPRMFPATQAVREHQDPGQAPFPVDPAARETALSMFHQMLICGLSEILPTDW